MEMLNSKRIEACDPANVLKYMPSVIEEYLDSPLADGLTLDEWVSIHGEVCHGGKLYQSILIRVENPTPNVRFRVDLQDLDWYERLCNTVGDILGKQVEVCVRADQEKVIKLSDVRFDELGRFFQKSGKFSSFAKLSDRTNPYQVRDMYDTLPRVSKFDYTREVAIQEEQLRHQTIVGIKQNRTVVTPTSTQFLSFEAAFTAMLAIEVVDLAKLGTVDHFLTDRLGLLVLVRKMLSCEEVYSANGSRNVHEHEAFLEKCGIRDISRLEGKIVVTLINILQGLFDAKGRVKRSKKPARNITIEVYDEAIKVFEMEETGTIGGRMGGGGGGGGGGGSHGGGGGHSFSGGGSHGGHSFSSGGGGGRSYGRMSSHPHTSISNKRSAFGSDGSKGYDHAQRYRRRHHGRYHEGDVQSAFLAGGLLSPLFWPNYVYEEPVYTEAIGSSSNPPNSSDGYSSSSDSDDSSYSSYSSSSGEDEASEKEYLGSSGDEKGEEDEDEDEGKPHGGFFGEYTPIQTLLPSRFRSQKKANQSSSHHAATKGWRSLLSSEGAKVTLKLMEKVAVNLYGYALVASEFSKFWVDWRSGENQLVREYEWEKGEKGGKGGVNHFQVCKDAGKGDGDTLRDYASRVEKYMVDMVKGVRKNDRLKASDITLADVLDAAEEYKGTDRLEKSMILYVVKDSELIKHVEKVSTYTSVLLLVPSGMAGYIAAYAKQKEGARRLAEALHVVGTGDKKPCGGNKMQRALWMWYYFYSRFYNVRDQEPYRHGVITLIKIDSMMNQGRDNEVFKGYGFGANVTYNDLTKLAKKRPFLRRMKDNISDSEDNNTDEDSTNDRAESSPAEEELPHKPTGDALSNTSPNHTPSQVQDEKKQGRGRNRSRSRGKSRSRSRSKNRSKSRNHTKGNNPDSLKAFLEEKYPNHKLSMEFYEKSGILGKIERYHSSRPTAPITLLFPSDSAWNDYNPEKTQRHRHNITRAKKNKANVKAQRKNAPNSSKDKKSERKTSSSATNKIARIARLYSSKAKTLGVGHYLFVLYTDVSNLGKNGVCDKGARNKDKKKGSSASLSSRNPLCRSDPYEYLMDLAYYTSISKQTITGKVTVLETKEVLDPVHNWNGIKRLIDSVASHKDQKTGKPDEVAAGWAKEAEAKLSVFSGKGKEAETAFSGNGKTIGLIAGDGGCVKRTISTDEELERLLLEESIEDYRSDREVPPEAGWLSNPEDSSPKGHRIPSELFHRSFFSLMTACGGIKILGSAFNPHPNVVVVPSDELLEVCLGRILVNDSKHCPSMKNKVDSVDKTVSALDRQKYEELILSSILVSLRKVYLSHVFNREQERDRMARKDPIGVTRVCGHYETEQNYETGKLSVSLGAKFYSGKTSDGEDKLCISLNGFVLPDTLRDVFGFDESTAVKGVSIEGSHKTCTVYNMLKNDQYDSSLKVVEFEGPISELYTKPTPIVVEGPKTEFSTLPEKYKKKVDKVVKGLDPNKVKAKLIKAKEVNSHVRGPESFSAYMRKLAEIIYKPAFSKGLKATLFAISDDVFESTYLPSWDAAITKLGNAWLKGIVEPLIVWGDKSDGFNSKGLVLRSMTRDNIGYVEITNPKDSNYHKSIAITASYSDPTYNNVFVKVHQSTHRPFIGN